MPATAATTAIHGGTEFVWYARLRSATTNKTACMHTFTVCTSWKLVNKLSRLLVSTSIYFTPCLRRNSGLSSGCAL